VTDIKTTTLVNTRLTKPEVNLQKHSLLSCMGIGRGTGGALAPWILKLLAKKGCFFNFERYKTNFTAFGPPWKKSFRRPCSAATIVVD